MAVEEAIARSKDGCAAGKSLALRRTVQKSSFQAENHFAPDYPRT
jgi:hypothetical protein